jgi:hypothetical protein
MLSSLAIVGSSTYRACGRTGTDLVADGGTSMAFDTTRDYVPGEVPPTGTVAPRDPRPRPAAYRPLWAPHWDHVRVGLQREGGGRVAESFTDHLGGGAGLQRGGSV